MTSTTSIFYDAITGESKKELKAEKKKALLEQEKNWADYNKKIASYKAKMGANGVVSFSDGLENSLAMELKNKNSLIANEFNEKLQQAKNKKKRQTLLSLGIKNI